ncbi:MAG: MFS transporter [Sphingobium sp.]|nr:MFS transporter [Sphingobium sp.]
MTAAVEGGATIAPLLLRKIHVRLIVPIAVITFVNSIDRMNISYAGHAMAGDLGMSPSAFGIAVSVFFVAYLLFQYPHSALLRRWGIKRWLLCSMLLWSASGLWMSQVRSPFEFYCARFLLGMAEAGFAPGMTYYIGTWVPRSARATAMAGALSAVPFSLVLGGPLCGWLLGVANPLGWEPWRWMFLLLALPNLLLAITAYFYFVDRPSGARWLSSAEKMTLAAAMADENADDPAPRSQPLATIVRDPWVWRCCLAWLLIMTGSYSLVFWLPQLVREIGDGQSEFTIGVLSSLPQLALLIGLILNGRHSDRSGERLWHVGLAAALAGATMMVASIIPAGWWVLALLTLAGLGIGAAQGVFWAIPSTVRIGGGAVPVGAIAIISMFGTMGGVIGPMLIGVIVSSTGRFAPAIAALAVLLILALFALIAGTRRDPRVPR